MAFVVIYDACVLYPAPLRDLLLRIALAGVVRARWSDEILDECFRNIAANRPELPLNALARTRELMCTAVPDCLVTNYNGLADNIALPDPHDRHVLAAAIRSNAQVIARDFRLALPPALSGRNLLDVAAAKRDWWADRWRTEMGTTVSVREVVEALEIASDEMSSYVNRVTGTVVTVTHEDLRLAEEDPLPDMPAWQQQAVTEAGRILESEDWLELPSKFDIHEWKIMDQFGRSLSTESERSAVADALHGSGAFRNFKATIGRLGIQGTWFVYKTLALETIAREWIEQNGLLPTPMFPSDDQVGSSTTSP